MDGTNIKEQVKLMRSVIGRKIMEIDEYADKATNTTGMESDKYYSMIEFLKNDVAGYKTIVEDLKDGSMDMTGNLFDIASLPAESVDLYMEFYRPTLSQEDLAEEDQAMELKSKYAVDLAKAYVIHIGRDAITDPRIAEIIMADEELIMMIGNAILDRPDILEQMQ